MLKNKRKIIYAVISAIIVVTIAIVTILLSENINELAKRKENDNKALTDSTDYNWNIEDLPYNNKFVDLKTYVTEDNKTSWSIALDENGDIWTWGENSVGQLGDNTYVSRKLPKKLSINAKFIQIGQGGRFWTALDTNGNIWGCGINNYGQIGNGYEYKDSDSTNIYAYTVAKPIQITSGTEFKKVVSSDWNTLALDKNGNIWGWGMNRYGVLMNEGKGNCSYVMDCYQNIPLQITSGTKYIDIEIDSTGCTAGAIDNSNNLYMWGCNDSGQLGVPKDTYIHRIPMNDGSGLSRTEYASYEPVQVKSGTKFNKLQIGRKGAIALDTDENLWAWGGTPTIVSGSRKVTDIYYYDDVYYAKIENSYNGYYMAGRK